MQIKTVLIANRGEIAVRIACLLYTSDAADE